ncbi:hypothetical protein [Aquimarina rhabdastrellae]
MKLLLKTIILAAVTISCGNSSIKNEEEIVIEQDPVITKEETSIELNNEQTKQSIEDIEECIFDLKTQTDDFIKRIPEFSNYKWDDKAKTGIILLKNNEQLLLKRGGCDHFEISGKWIQQRTGHALEEIPYWFEQCRWISKRILSEIDYASLEKMIQDKSFEVDITNNRLYINFSNHDYIEWYLAVDMDDETHKNNVVIETGYYLN